MKSVQAFTEKNPLLSEAMDKQGKELVVGSKILLFNRNFYTGITQQQQQQQQQQQLQPKWTWFLQLK